MDDYITYQTDLINNSGLFNHKFYRNQFQLDWTSIDCVAHFCKTWKTHLVSPSPLFDICKYLAANPDVALSGVNPLLHYLSEGRFRGRRKWAIDEKFYKPEIFAPLAMYGANLESIPFKHKRIAIFAGYSKYYVIEDYVIWYLEELNEICDAIIYVSDNYLPIQEINKIRDIVSCFDCRKKSGFDHGSWKCGLKIARDYNLISRCDEVILCNDSMYGPTTSLEPLFTRMHDIDCDFWGLTNAHGGHEHIQSFFMVIKCMILATPLVDDFLQKVSSFDSLKELIKNGEHRFTEMLLANGFKYAVVSDFVKKYNTGLRHDIMDDPAKYPADLLESGVPFVKRKNFTQYKTYNRYGIYSILKILKKSSPGLYNLITNEFRSCLLENCNARFSLIMRAYNRAHIICNAIESLLNQTYQSFELIIVDDGSKDNTEEVIKNRYADLIASGKIIYHRHSKNMGISHGSNTGISLARNEWIGHLDTDNNLRPNFLEQFAIAIRNNPDSKTFIARFKRIFSGEEEGGEFDVERLKLGNYIDVGIFVFHKSLFQELGGFDIKLKTVNDYDIITRYCQHYPPYYIDSVLLDYCDDTTDRLSNIIPYEREKRRVRHNNFGMPSVLSIVDIGDGGIFDKPLLSALLAQAGQFYHNVALINSTGADISFYENYLSRLNNSLSTLVHIITSQELSLICDNNTYDYLFLVLDKKIIPTPYTVLNAVNEAASSASISTVYLETASITNGSQSNYTIYRPMFDPINKKSYVCIHVCSISRNFLTCVYKDQLARDSQFRWSAKHNITPHLIPRRKRP